MSDRFALVEASRQGEAPLAYLDNAATTHKPECVLAAMDAYYREANANVGRGSYPLAGASAELYERARASTARFVNCAPDELVFTSGATEGLNLAAYAWGSANLRPGDEVALTIAEHHSCLLPWQDAAHRAGARVVYLLPDAEGRISDEEIDAKVGPRTKAVAVAHVSNVLGSVFPVRRIADAAHAHGAVVAVDCAQSVAHMPVDADELGADFLAFSAHKMYGPQGVGALCVRREAMAGMEPFMRGGGMVDGVFEQRAGFVDGPRRFEAGTPNVAGAVGLAEAVRFLQRTGFEAVRAHEIRLLDRMLSGLAAIPGVRVHGDPCPPAPDAPFGPGGRCGVVSFNVAGLDAYDVAEALARENIAVRAGAHCAEPLVRHLGERATCRASLAVYNDEKDVDRFLDAVSRAKRTVGRMILARMH